MMSKFWQSAKQWYSQQMCILLPTVKQCPVCYIDIPYRTCGLQSTSAQQKHSSRNEGGSKIHTAKLMCQASCYQIFLPPVIQRRKYSGDLAAQNYGTWVSRTAQKWMQHKRWHQSLPRSTRAQTSNEYILSWKEN